MANSYSPEVAAILETLRQLGPPKLQHQAQSHAISPSTSSNTVQQPGSPIPQATQQAPPAPRTDPTTITTWPPALRYVLKTIAANEHIISSIRRLINTQHTHEREWHTARVALLHQHSQRPANRAKLSAILSAVNPSLRSSSMNNDKTQEEQMELKKEREELEAFDKKVYRAQTEMVTAISKELERMGVPFFGLRKEFLMQGEGTIQEQMDGRNEEPRDTETDKINEKELLILQRRMVEILENLAVE